MPPFQLVHFSMALACQRPRGAGHVCWSLPFRPSGSNHSIGGSRGVVVEVEVVEVEVVEVVQVVEVLEVVESVVL